MKLKDKVAVITGGASGMGRDTVLRFLDEGAKVVIADYNEASGTRTLDQVEKAGHDMASVRFIRTDVAVEEQVEAMIDLAVSEFGRLDILFNNAGIGGALGPIWEIDVKDWDYTFDVCTKGVFLGIKHGSRVMMRQGGGGSIINTSSISAVSGDGGPLAYTAAKTAVVGLTRAAAVQLADEKIRVNAICPGAILTEATQGDDPEAMAKLFVEAQPWPVHGKGENIAGTAVFLASDDSMFMTGQALVVDGGLTIAGPGAGKMFMAMNGVTHGTTGQE